MRGRKLNLYLSSERLVALTGVYGPDFKAEHAVLEAVDRLLSSSLTRVFVQFGAEPVLVAVLDLEDAEALASSLDVRGFAPSAFRVWTEPVESLDSQLFPTREDVPGLSPDCGVGYVSPEQYVRVLAAAGVQPLPDLVWTEEWRGYRCRKSGALHLVHFHPEFGIIRLRGPRSEEERELSRIRSGVSAATAWRCVLAPPEGFDSCEETFGSHDEFLAWAFEHWDGATFELDVDGKSCGDPRLYGDLGTILVRVST